jgi:hypothetical protein
MPTLAAAVVTILCDGAGPFGSSSSRIAGSPKGDRMFSRSMLTALLFATILLAALATGFAAGPTDQASSVSTGSIRTYLTPDLSLKSTFVVPALPQPSTGARKTCRCSCGTAPCARDADCGGAVGSCSAFISCCAKGDAARRFSSADQSSRQTELPAFKSECN